MRLRRVLLICLALPLALWVTLPLVSSADPQGRISSIQGKIQSKQGKLDKVNGKARVLTSDISALTARIDALQGTISTLQGREDAIQSDLDAKRRELSRTQTQLRAVRARLVRLRARFAHARTVLAQRLVEIYKADEPDVISVVLDSHGFADLLENGAYLRRIGEQDREIITAVRDAKEAMAGAARRLGRLLARADGVDFEGLRIRQVGSDREGAVWSFDRPAK